MATTEGLSTVTGLPESIASTGHALQVVPVSGGGPAGVTGAAGLPGQVGVVGITPATGPGGTGGTVGNSGGLPVIGAVEFGPNANVFIHMLGEILVELKNVTALLSLLSDQDIQNADDE